MKIYVIPSVARSPIDNVNAFSTNPNKGTDPVPYIPQEKNKIIWYFVFTFQNSSQRYNYMTIQKSKNSNVIVPYLIFRQFVNTLESRSHKQWYIHTCKYKTTSNFSWFESVLMLWNGRKFKMGTFCTCHFSHPVLSTYLVS